MVLRIWPALASWGAGLILFAVAAGAPPWAAVALCLWAVATFGWGVIALRAVRLPAPRTTLACALGAVAVGLVLVLAGTLGPVPFAALTVLHLLVAGCAAASLRRGPSAARHERPGRTVFALVAGALAVAALTTPALAFTEPGSSAVPHGEDPGGHRH
ncbi:hypothetical protein N8K70_08570 [Microbacterium betulae]|uniref:Uncharacterized protein n=1 Tax=Microbacterium betulae TaxID=2981139 RepID=A0AA97FH76_9MICO|nr:hypothetical protein [Microbacterium sp. AB]WOF21457.1 hypothetical protein N8K70_08570 [Microbacterium sp. AB]